MTDEQIAEIRARAGARRKWKCQAELDRKVLLDALGVEQARVRELERVLEAIKYLRNLYGKPGGKNPYIDPSDVFAAQDAVDAAIADADKQGE